MPPERSDEWSDDAHPEVMTYRHDSLTLSNKGRNDGTLSTLLSGSNAVKVIHMQLVPNDAPKSELTAQMTGE